MNTLVLRNKTSTKRQGCLRHSLPLFSPERTKARSRIRISDSAAGMDPGADGLALRKHPHLPDNTKVHPALASLAGFKCSPDHAVPKLLTGGRLT